MTNELFNDFPYHAAMLSVDDLLVDDRYQRPLNRQLHRLIASDFNPSLYLPLTVSERAHGEYAVVDGQNRLEGGRLRGFQSVPCLVFQGLTPEEEAVLFVETNRARKALRPYDQYHGALFANLPWALQLLEATEDTGFRIMAHGDAGPGGITAVVALRDVLAQGGPPLLTQMLQVVKAAWWAQDGATEGEILKGIAWFIDGQEGKVDLERLASNLDAYSSPENLKKLVAKAKFEAGGSGQGGGSTGYWTQAVAKIYRKQVPNG